MVSLRIDIAGTQCLRHVLTVFAAQAVDDDCLLVVATDHLAHLGVHVDARHNAISQVRSIKLAHQGHRIAQMELLGDVGANALSGGGGVGVHAGPR